MTEVQSWGLKPCWTTGDSWYSSVGNLKFLREEKVSFLFGVAENRKVSLIQGTEVQIQTLEIPEAGLMVYLKEFSWVKVFSQDFKTRSGTTLYGNLNLKHSKNLIAQCSR